MKKKQQQKQELYIISVVDWKRFKHPSYASQIEPKKFKRLVKVEYYYDGTSFGNYSIIGPTMELCIVLPYNFVPTFSHHFVPT